MGPSGFDSSCLQDEHFAVMAGCSLSSFGFASVAEGQCGARGAVGALVFWCSWSPRAALIIHHSDPCWHAADQEAQCAALCQTSTKPNAMQYLQPCTQTSSPRESLSGLWPGIDMQFNANGFGLKRIARSNHRGRLAKKARLCDSGLCDYV